MSQLDSLDSFTTIPQDVSLSADGSDTSGDLTGLTSSTDSGGSNGVSGSWVQDTGSFLNNLTNLVNSGASAVTSLANAGQTLGIPSTVGQISPTQVATPTTAQGVTIGGTTYSYTTVFLVVGGIIALILIAKK